MTDTDMQAPVIAGESKILVCKDCGNDFEFSAREQEFYQAHGYVEPRRCKPCRKAKKARFANEDNKVVSREFVGDRVIEH